MPTMDFEVYLNTNAPAAERATALAELFRNEDAAGVEYAVVMPSPTPSPDNSALYETAHARAARRPRAARSTRTTPTRSTRFGAPSRDWGMRVLKIMPAIYHVHDDRAAGHVADGHRA